MMLLDDERSFLYDTIPGTEGLLAVGVWVRLWVHGGGHGTVLRRNAGTCVNIPCICCFEEEFYGILLTLNVQLNQGLTNNAPVASSLESVGVFYCLRYGNTLD